MPCLAVQKVRLRELPKDAKSWGPKESRGKGGHCRQWRQCMPAFLNRNERRNAATIEVAERSESPLVAPAGAKPSAKQKKDLQKMPIVGGRRFPKGDRKALWSRQGFRYHPFGWHRKVATRLDLSEKGQPCRRETPCQTKTNLPKDSYRRGPKVPKGTVGHSRRTGCLFPGKRHQPRGCGKPFQLRHICSASRASGDESPAACSACLSS